MRVRGSSSWVVIVAALAWGCGTTPSLGTNAIASTSASSATAPPPTPCERAAADRARVPELFARGKLDRVGRVLAHANALCPETARDSLAPGLRALVEVGRYDEARTLAMAIEASTDAPEAARAAVVETRAQLEHPDATPGADLVEAGLAARDAGDLSRAQRLFDRAIVALEREAKSPVVLEPPQPWLDTITTTASLAMSPSGDMLAVPTLGAISIRDKRVGYRETQRIELVPADLFALAFSPDGRTLVAGFGDGVVRMYDPATWAEVRSFTHELASVPVAEHLDALAFSPDGKLLATASGDGGFNGTVALWTVGTGKLLRKLEGPRAGGGSLGFSSDGKTLSTLTWQQGLRSWTVATGRVQPPAPDPRPALVERLEGVVSRAGLSSLRVLDWAYGANDTVLAVLLSDAQVHLLDTTSAAERLVVPVASDSGEIQLTSDGALLVVHHEDRTEVFAIGATAKRLGVLPARVDGPFRSPDGQTVVFQAADGPRVIDVATGALRDVGRPRRDDGSATGIGISRDGARVAFGSADYAYRLLDARPAASVRTLVQAHAIASTFGFTPDGAAISVCNSNVFGLIDASTAKELQAFDTPKYPRSSAFAPDGRSVAIGGHAEVELRETETWTVTRKFAFEGVWVRSVDVSANGARLVVGTDRKGISLFDLPSPSPAPQRTFPGTEAEFSPNGSLIAIASPSGISFVSAETGAEQRGYDTQPEAAHDLVFSTDGEHLAAGVGESGWGLWSVTGPRRADRFDAAGRLAGIAFSPRGDVVILSDGALRVRDFSGAPLVDVHVLEKRDAGYVVTASAGSPIVELLGPDLAAARAAFVCRLGSASYPFDLCRERHEPADVDAPAPRGVLARALAGDTSYLDP